MKITEESILSDGFWGKSMFHPKMTLLPDGKLLMLVQEINGSDSYGPVLQAYSANQGRDWSTPEAVPSLGWREPDRDGIVEGVCDTVPDVDSATERAVAVGHSVYYRDGRFFDTLGFWNKSECRPDLRRRGVYSVRREDGSWSARKAFAPTPLEDCECACCGCSQKVIHPDGNWLIPFYFRKAPADGGFSVAVAKFRLEKEEFVFAEMGNVLKNPSGRGLLEPSIFRWQEAIWMTLRAEDGHAYFATSQDGLHFGAIRPWEFDDGTPFVTSTTQQHFTTLGGRFYLVYTRDAGFNHKVFRVRTPLFIAEIDTPKRCLMRQTEQIVLTADGDYEFPESIGIFGNFLPCPLNADEVLVSDGMVKPYRGYKGLAKLARIRS